MSKTIYVNVVATAAPTPPVTVYYWDGTSRDVFFKDGELNLGPEHLIKQVVVRTTEASPDCVLSVGTIDEAKA